MDTRTFPQLSRYLLLIVANALPVFGAFTGKIVFFQVLWIYWVESLFLIGFDIIRIAFAKGSGAGPDGDQYVRQALEAIGDTGVWSVFSRLKMIIGTLIIRGLILAFYLLFLIIFVGLQVTDDSHTLAVGRSIAFQDPFVNTALAVFLINGFVQLIAGFFLNGRYRQVSPRMYTDIVSARTIVLHVMIISSVFIHQFIFEDKPYAWIGESVYVGIFMLIRTVLDIRSMRKQDREATGRVVLI